jgi:hypothetical protein
MKLDPDMHIGLRLVFFGKTGATEWYQSFFRSTSELLHDVVDEDGGTACTTRNETDGRDALLAGWPKSGWERTRAVVMPSSDGYEAFGPTVLGNRASLLWPLRGCNSHLTSRVSGVGNTELDNGQPVRSQWREHGCGRRWRSGVLASYGPDTERMGSNGPKNRPCWGEEREELRALTASARDCNKEKLSKSFDRSWVSSLARFRGIEGMSTDHGRISDG